MLLNKTFFSTSDSDSIVYTVIIFSIGILTNDDNSLFTYLPYESFENVRDPAFTPTFEINPDSANVSICGGDPFCIYDIVSTGDQEVGVATLQAVADVQEVVDMSYPGIVIVCRSFPCVYYGINLHVK